MNPLINIFLNFFYVKCHQSVSMSYIKLAVVNYRMSPMVVVSGPPGV